VEQRGHTYVSSDVLEAEGADARYLIDGGFCEIVRRFAAAEASPA
jgi:hypothetical protein